MSCPDDQLPFFVYGTLRPQEANYYLLKGQTVTEIAAQAFGVELYSLGAYPMAISAPADKVIQGTLISVKPDGYSSLLQQLDWLEEVDMANHPYQRVIYPIQLNSGATVQAWFYMGNPHFLQRVWHRLILDGDWVNYRQNHHVPRFVGLEA